MITSKSLAALLSLLLFMLRNASADVCLRSICLTNFPPNRTWPYYDGSGQSRGAIFFSSDSYTISWTGSDDRYPTNIMWVISSPYSTVEHGMPLWTTDYLWKWNMTAGQRSFSFTPMQLMNSKDFFVQRTRDSEWLPGNVTDRELARYLASWPLSHFQLSQPALPAHQRRGQMGRSEHASSMRYLDRSPWLPRTWEPS
jgi:hypothetical protein